MLLDWDPEVHLRPAGAVETACHHANDRRRTSVHEDRSPDDGRVGAKASLPECVAEHHCGIGVALAVGARVEDAAGDRPRAEFGQVVGRHELRGGGRVAVASRQHFLRHLREDR